MEKKYPVLKCNKELWEEIKPVLESFGITEFTAIEFDNIINSYLITNYFSANSNKIEVRILPYANINVIKLRNRYLVNTKEEFLSAVAKLLGKEYPISSKNNKDIEKINVAEKLKHCKKGTKLYHLMFGEVEFHSITDNNKIVIIISNINNSKENYFVEHDGTYYSDYPNGECLLFPSKDNRDWNTFQLLKEGHRVMCSYEGEIWGLHEFAFNKKVKSICNKEELYEPKYIVPIEDFDFTAEDITINKERSII